MFHVQYVCVCCRSGMYGMDHWRMSGLTGHRPALNSSWGTVLIIMKRREIIGLLVTVTNICYIKSAFLYSINSMNRESYGSINLDFIGLKLFIGGLKVDDIGSQLSWVQVEKIFQYGKKDANGICGWMECISCHGLGGEATIDPGANICFFRVSAKTKCVVWFC